MSDETYQIEMLWDCPAGHYRILGRHKICTECERPKTDDESFYMPDDTSSVTRIVDRDLLTDALAGEDWHCRYCQSSQKRRDGSCANCGSDQSETISVPHSYSFGPKSKPAPSKRPEKLPPPARLPKLQKEYPLPLEEEFVPKQKWNKWFLAIPGVLFLIGLLIWGFQPKEYDTVVSDVYFQHIVHVERYQVVNDSGWDYPARAFDVSREGKRVHHHDKVIDHYDTEKYKVDVSDGETCHTTPVKVTKGRCKSNKNGFATCSSDKRSGGDRICKTKYRKENRTRKVPVYRDEPVYREWYSWKEWTWRPNRHVEASGHTLDVRWPSEEEIALCGTCSSGEQERVVNDDSYSVKFTNEVTKDDSWNYSPKTLNEFKTYPIGSKHHIRVTMGMVTVVPKL